MPRAALIPLAAAAFLGALLAAAPVAALDPHMDPSRLPLGCPACHESHGAPRSPMLPAAQKQVCLACHDTQARLDREVIRGAVSPSARPPLLAPVLTQPYGHPVSEQAFSELEDGEVTCTSCHSPHRGMPAGRSDPIPNGRRYLSPKSPNRLEHELCLGCHGSRGGAAVGAGLLDIGRLLAPSSRSYHPVEAPALDRSPSVVPRLAGREINCTDCHGASDAAAPRGPHGSSVPYVLRRNYTLGDGAEESAATYALCYDCHRREAVLESSLFPEHREHIVEERASCATCHSPHGSLNHRALIRFGEETTLGGVGPSGRTGRLAFVSTGPGSGACYLTCHGVDHAPETYGGMAVEPALGTPDGGGPRSLPPAPREPGLRPLPPPRSEPRDRPPARPPDAGGQPAPGRFP